MIFLGDLGKRKLTPKTLIGNPLEVSPLSLLEANRHRTLQTPCDRTRWRRTEISPSTRGIEFVPGRVEADEHVTLPRVQYFEERNRLRPLEGS